MAAPWTRGIRASIVARARFIDDLVLQKLDEGVTQYVILGAGLDTFAQRRPDSAARLSIYEVDRPGAQAWKCQRLAELGFDIPGSLHFVPVEFEAGMSWWEQLVAAGFDADKPAVFASTGVSMYLSDEANAATLRRIASCARGTALAMTFLLRFDLVDPQDRPMAEAAKRGAEASGTPFVSFFTPQQILDMARQAGFAQAEHVSASSYAQRYFAGRTDGLQPASGEDLLIAMA